MDFLPSAALHRARDIIDIMDHTSRVIYEGKKKALPRGDDDAVEQIGRGKDIMGVLSKLYGLLCRRDLIRVTICSASKSRRCRGGALTGGPITRADEVRW